LPGRLSVRDAHDVPTRIEEAVRRAFPDMEVTVHIEPIEEEAAWQDSAMLHVEQEETQGKEDKETRRPGDKETGEQGDKETRRQGDKETGRQGDKENAT